MDERRSGAVVALKTAVRRICAVVYCKEPASAERLATLAQAVAAVVPVYVQDASGELRLVRDEDLRDGTVDLADVLVSRTSVEHAIEMLKARDDPSQPPADALADPLTPRT
jgi:hypothetical protein